MTWYEGGTVAQRYAELRKLIPNLEHIESPLGRYDAPDACPASTPRKIEGYHLRQRRPALVTELKPEMRLKKTASAAKVRYQRKVHPAQPGEIPLKVFIQERAQAEGISLRSVWGRFYRHQYAIAVRRVNCRVVFVRAATAPAAPAQGAEGR